MAATDLERLVVQLSADIKGYENAMRRAQGVTNRQLGAIQKKALASSTAIAGAFVRSGAQIAAAFAASEIIRNAGDLSDAATRIDNSLKVAGLSGLELEKVYQRLNKAAIANGAPIETLATLYGKAAQSQKELGASTEDLITFSNNVALALRVAGTDAQAASGALLQLGQALGSGTVHAEEFNSVLEGAPTIAQAVAAGLKEAGGSVAQLKGLVVDGKVSSEAFFRAFEAGAPMLQDKVAGSVFTIEQATVNLKTALIDVVREFNNSTGASERFAGGINSAARAINDFDVSGLIQKIRDAKTELDGYLNSLGNAQIFKDLAANLGVLDDKGNVVNLDATKAKDETSSLEKEVQLLQQRIQLNTELGFDNTEALARLGEVQSALAQVRANAAGIAAGIDVPGFTGGNGLVEPLGGGTNGQMGGSSSRGGSRRNPVKPVSISDFKPPVGKSTGGGRKGGGSGKGHDSYQSEIDSIKERTAALQAETAAQATVNPLIDDYGAAQARAQTASDLFTAAQKSGTAAGKELADVQQLLSGNFANLSPAARQQAEAMLALADGYAKATAESQRLAASQDKMRDAAQQFADAGKDVTKGFISDLMDGKSAADALGGALKKVADILLDQVLDAIFQVKGAGGGGGGLGGLFSSIFGGGGAFPAAPSVGLFADGGYTGPGGKHSPAGVVHKGEVVWSQADIRRAGGVAAVEAMRRGVAGYANGGPVGMRAPSLPSIRRGGGQNVSVRSEVEVSVSDSGELRAYVKRTSAETAEGVSRQHIAKFSEKDLPNRFTQIEGNRRKR